jgi:hypothetical protein
MQSARQSDSFPQCPFFEIIRVLCSHQALMHSSSLWCGHHARRSSPEQKCFRYFSKQSQRGIKVGNRESWAPSSRSITSVSSLASRRGQPKLTIIRRRWPVHLRRFQAAEAVSGFPHASRPLPAVLRVTSPSNFAPKIIPASLRP